MDETPEPHEATLAVWDIPAAVAANERFAVKVGAKSAAGCVLAGCVIVVTDQAGAVLAEARLGEQPWPGTEALFVAAVELTAPGEPGTLALTAHFQGAASSEPHRNAVAPFNVVVVAKPEHTLTVDVMAGGVPVDDVHVRLGPHRAVTDASGRARLKLAKGRYEIVTWKAGFDTPTLPLTLEADAAVTVEALAVPEEHPDAHWTA